MTAGRGPNAPNLYAPWALARLPAGWTGGRLFGSVRAQSAYPGEVAERLNAPVLKTGVPSRGPWVRIPPSPPTTRKALAGIRDSYFVSTSSSRFSFPQAAGVPHARGFSIPGVRP